MILVSLTLVSLVLRAPHRCRVPPPQMLKGRALPDELRALGMDDALWAATRNKKGLLQLLRKGKTEFLGAGYRTCRSSTMRRRHAGDAGDAGGAGGAGGASSASSDGAAFRAAASRGTREEPPGSGQELAAAQMPEELRPYGMDEPLWLEVKDKRSLIKLLRRRGFDFLEARITRCAPSLPRMHRPRAGGAGGGHTEAVVAAAAESEEWFEEGAEEAELKRRFKELRGGCTPTGRGAAGCARELGAEFQELQAETSGCSHSARHTPSASGSARAGSRSAGCRRRHARVAARRGRGGCRRGGQPRARRGGGADGGADGAPPAPVRFRGTPSTTRTSCTSASTPPSRPRTTTRRRGSRGIDALLNTGPQLWSIKTGDKRESWFWAFTPRHSHLKFARAAADASGCSQPWPRRALSSRSTSCSRTTGSRTSDSGRVHVVADGEHDRDAVQLCRAARSAQGDDPRAAARRVRGDVKRRARCDKESTHISATSTTCCGGGCAARAFQLTANRSYLGRSVEIFDDATTRVAQRELRRRRLLAAEQGRERHEEVLQECDHERALPRLAGGLALHHHDAARAGAARSWAARQATWFLKSG